MNKIPVSNLTLIIYISTVVSSSLLVTLIPIYVDLPVCDDQSIISGTNTSGPITIGPITSGPIETEPSSSTTSSTSTSTKITTTTSTSTTTTFTSTTTTLTSTLGNIPYCDEINKPMLPMYPWYDPRLPQNVYPIHYDLYLNLPLWKFNTSVYDGTVDITINITEPTEYILMHTAIQGIPILKNFFDKSNRNVEILCNGEYLSNQYFIIKTKQKLRVEDGPFQISMSFIAAIKLNGLESGLFEFNFAPGANPSQKNLTMLASKFEPVDARRAFPCFDQPNMKATFSISIDHPPGTIALTNTPKINDVAVGFEIDSQFEKTERMATSKLGIVVFYEKDFKKISNQTASGIPLNIWARNHYIDEDQADIALDMCIKIFNELEDIFKGVKKDSLPAKIDIFAIPDYPIDAVSHFGIPIFAENKILMKATSASQRNKQDTALLIAKQLTEFWLGNYVTFKWWDELYLQESFGDFIKYIAVERAFPNFQIRSQFITEELVSVLINDGYPCSPPVLKPVNSPYEIEQLFDDVERSKGSAILRMMELEVGETVFFQAIQDYLNANSWGNGDSSVFLNSIGKIGPWNATEFFDRWFNQANYPEVTVSLSKVGGKTYMNVNQERHLNSNYSLFHGELLYPSDYNFIWFIPLKCGFGFLDSQNYTEEYEELFHFDSRQASFEVHKPNDLLWVQCNRQFSGYYVANYDASNWAVLASELQSNSINFTPEDKSSLIHHAFVQSYSPRSSYSLAVDILSYIKNEDNYLPWRTLYVHLQHLLGVLDYNKAFLHVSTFFIKEINRFEQDDLWSSSDVHINDLLSETILELSCRLQDKYCINKVAELWPIAMKPNSVNTIPPHVRSIIYNYHFQNTYNVKDWEFFFRLYDVQNDILEEERYLKALTFTRLPWLLSELIESEDERINSLDTFDLLKYLSVHPLGRELAWDYLRANYRSLVNKYGKDDFRLGQLLLDITETFEDEYMFYELLEFLYFTTEADATLSSRFKASEIVTTNIFWLISKEKDIELSFGKGGTKAHLEQNTSRTPISLEKMIIKLEQINKEFQKGDLKEKKKAYDANVQMIY